MSIIKIIHYSPEFQSYFESINKAWVSHYFTLEPFDIDQLEHPEEAILAKGGVILFAKLGEAIVGTVGLIPKNESVCEMIKMGVDPSSQGKGVGLALGNAVMEEGRKMGFSKIVLYTNSKLLAALNLYKKLGFLPVAGECGSYERCDIKMEKLI